ncbi:hypothetical protein ABPG72_004629 [Tetrahymena utriculariae]
MFSTFRVGLWRQTIIHTSKNNKINIRSTLSRLAQVNVNQMRFHFSAQPQTLEKINNYESIFTAINSSESITDILKIFRENEDIYKSEHLASTARSFARIFKQNMSKSDFEALKDPLYQQLTGKIANNLQSFNEVELLDLIFWIRKCKHFKLPLHNMETKVADCTDRVIEYVKKESYNIKQLATVHFDVSHIGRNCEEICQQLIQEIKKDSSKLTPFIVMNLMQSISLKQGFNSGRELILIDLLTKSLPNIYEQLDVQQKSLIFKCIAYIEPQITPPKYKIPQVLYDLRVDLKEKLDSLNESNVLNILQGYQYLIYSSFPQDLLEEIKDMIIVTVKHHPNNMKSVYLLDYIELITQFNKKKKTDVAKMNILIKELTKRITEKDEHLLHYRIDKIIQYCDRYIRANSSIIVELCKQYEIQIKNHFNQSLLELASKKVPLENFDSLLESFFGNKNSQEKLEIVSKLSKPIQIRLCISLYHHRDRHLDLFNELQKQVEEYIDKDPLVVIVSLKSSIIYHQFKKDLMIRSVQNYINTRQSDSDGQICKAMICSSEYKEVRKIWTSQFLKNKQLETQFVHKFLEMFFAQDQYENQEKLFLFIYVLQCSKIFPAKMLINCIKDNTRFVQDVVKFDSIFRKLIFEILKNLKQQPDSIRLINIYQIFLRLESLGYRSESFYKFMSQVLDICYSANKKNELSSYIGFIYQIKLLDSNNLKVEYAKSAFENQYIVDINQKGKLLSLIAKHDTQYYNNNREQYDIYFKNLLASMNSNQPNQILHSIAAILRMPTHYLKQDHYFIVKSLKENISGANDLQYTNLFTSIPFTGGLYAPIIQELIAHFPQICKRMIFPDIRRILQKVAELNLKDQQLLTLILQEIGANFFTMSCEDRIFCVISFCNLRIRQDDFIDKTLRLIIDNMASYRSYYLMLTESLYRVGFHSDTLHEFLKKALKFWRFSCSEYMSTLMLLTISKDRQGELLNEISVKLSNPSNYLDSMTVSFNNQYFNLSTLYYSMYHQSHPEILKFISKCYGDQKLANPTKFIFYHNKYPTIQKYLQAMGIDYIVYAQIDKYEVPLFIPATRQIVKVNSLTNLNFDRKTLDGKSQTEQLILGGIPDVEIVEISIPEFMGLGSDYLQKINYLIKQGIKSNNLGVYDFSKLQASTNEEQQEELNQTEQNEVELNIGMEEDILSSADLEESKN